MCEPKYAPIALVVIISVSANGGSLKWLFAFLVLRVPFREMRDHMVIAQQLPQSSLRRRERRLDRGTAATDMALVLPVSTTCAHQTAIDTSGAPDFGCLLSSSQVKE